MIDVLEHAPAKPIEGCDVRRCVIAITPSAEEQSRLADEYGLPDEFIRHSLDADERPHVERLAGIYFLVVRIPCVEPVGAPAPYATAPLGLIASDDTLAIVCGRETRVVGLLRDYAAAASTWRRRRIALHTLRLAAETYLTDLKTINDAVDVLEDRLRESLENREVLELLRHQKALVFFSTALESNLLLLERLHRDESLPAAPGDLDLLEDILVETRQALDVTKTSRDILSEMMDAFASIISNNLNNVMRFLAAITVVLTVPVLVASFWGMNVKLPLGPSPHGFGVLVLTSLALSVGLVLVFRRKRWL